jgi:hypothetical protein
LLAFGVGHPVSTATSFSGLALLPHLSLVAPFQSLAADVGQPCGKPQSLSDVRRPDATSAKYDRPRGVTFSLQRIE